MTASSGKVLYYLGKPADGFGWGVANTNLVKHLSTICEVRVITTDRNRFDAPVFVPVADLGLRPDRAIKAPRVLAYGFWEYPLEREAAKINAGRYQWIFAGSEWCANRVREATGASHVSALVQGADAELFKPQPWQLDRKGFRVFSGGKYEFRKAQDIVLAAMRVFMKQRGDAVLIAAWHNPWPITMKSMEQSWLLDAEKPFDGIPEDRFIKLPPLRNAEMPPVYANSDVGLFPNRCEGGTNMVMTEYMACGRPVIATCATGQADILEGYPLNLTQGSWDCAGWWNNDIADVLVQLERLYQNRELLEPLGEEARKRIEPFTWQKCAEAIAEKAFA